MKYIQNVVPFFTDARGTISHLIDDSVKIQGVLLLTCKKGAIRASHYHKKDTHYSYMVSGSMEYTWRALGSKTSKKQSRIVKAGEMVFSPSMVAHSMKFLEDSVFIAFATKPRTRKEYEHDTVRVDTI